MHINIQESSNGPFLMRTSAESNIFGHVQLFMEIDSSSLGEINVTKYVMALLS
jgi:hypothetical protein